jgi:TonB-like protein
MPTLSSFASGELGGSVPPCRPQSLICHDFADPGTVQVKLVKRLRPDFDAATTNAVSTWRFEPAIEAGKPVAMRIETEINLKNEMLRTVEDKSGCTSKSPGSQANHATMTTYSKGALLIMQWRQVLPNLPVRSRPFPPRYLAPSSIG